MVNVTSGDETMEIERRAETAPGKFETVGSDSVAAREVYWRRLQAGQGGVLGGQFTAPGGSRFSLPAGDYGWVWMEHSYEAPTTLRYIVVPETEDQPNAVYLWNPSDSSGIAVSGTTVEFKRAKRKSATAGELTIGWEWPAEAEKATENNPSGTKLNVVFTPGPNADGGGVFGSEVHDEIQRQKRAGGK